MKNRFSILIVGLLFAFSTASHAGTKYTKEGFSLPDGHNAKILVFYPDIFVGVVDGKGVKARTPDKEELARKNINMALKNGPIGNAYQIQFMTEQQYEAYGLAEDFWQSFHYIRSDIMFKVPQGTIPLPNNDLKLLKGKKGKYNYTFDMKYISAMPNSIDADYILVMHMYDAYSTGGAKIGKLLSGMANVVATGANTERGRQGHHGNTVLVDAKTGDIVWLYGDGAFGGDPRKAKGAIKRIKQATYKFPGI